MSQSSRAWSRKADDSRSAGFPVPSHPAIPRDAPRALIFSPHPDDECIIGGLALRFMREAGMRVLNVAVTQGSNKARQAGSLDELRAACDYSGSICSRPRPVASDNINAGRGPAIPDSGRLRLTSSAESSRRSSRRSCSSLTTTDWNRTHIGTHFWSMDALARQPANFACHVVETEFWGAMATPNLMVESSVADLAEMMTASSFHVGEVQRNPYHLLVPSWMQDNVRRGGELVGGQGGAAPDFAFCTLYRRSLAATAGFSRPTPAAAAWPPA